MPHFSLASFKVMYSISHSSNISIIFLDLEEYKMQSVSEL